MIQFLRQKVPTLIFIVLISAMLVLMSHDVGNRGGKDIAGELLFQAGAPAVRAGSSATAFVSDLFRNYADLRGARAESLRLSEELLRTQRELDRLREKAAAGERLQGLLELKQSLPPGGISARVVGSGFASGADTLLIDRGHQRRHPGRDGRDRRGGRRGAGGDGRPAAREGPVPHGHRERRRGHDGPGRVAGGRDRQEQGRLRGPVPAAPLRRGHARRPARHERSRPDLPAGHPRRPHRRHAEGGGDRPPLRGGAPGRFLADRGSAGPADRPALPSGRDGRDRPGSRAGGTAGAR